MPWSPADLCDLGFAKLNPPLLHRPSANAKKLCFAEASAEEFDSIARAVAQV